MYESEFGWSCMCNCSWHWGRPVMVLPLIVWYVHYESDQNQTYSCWPQYLKLTCGWVCPGPDCDLGEYDREAPINIQLELQELLLMAGQLRLEHHDVVHVLRRNEGDYDKAKLVSSTSGSCQGPHHTRNFASWSSVWSWQYMVAIIIMHCQPWPFLMWWWSVTINNYQ